MDVYVARQPIFDSETHLYAYEFLFRDGLSNAFPDLDGDTATSRLLTNTFFTIGIDRLSGQKKFFVNFTRDLLLKRVPTMFPADSLVVEILEDVEPEAELVEACREISAAGYTVALDDFLFRPELKPLIELAHIIKIDLRQTPINRAEKLIRALGGHRLTFLAEKVETHEEFEQAKELGFELFQGYFFSKPEIVQGKDIKPAKITLLQLIQETRRPDCNIDDLDRLINRDVSLSYKLLRYINSAFFRRLMEITSIRHAIALLGERELRQFIALVATAELAQDKPQELIRSAIIRARFCELLGEDSCRPWTPRSFSCWVSSPRSMPCSMPEWAPSWKRFPCPTVSKTHWCPEQGRWPIFWVWSRPMHPATGSVAPASWKASAAIQPPCPIITWKPLNGLTHTAGCDQPSFPTLSAMTSKALATADSA